MSLDEFCVCMTLCPFKLLFTSSQPRRLRPKSQLLSLRLKAAGKIEAAGDVSMQQCVLWLLVVDDFCGSSPDPKDRDNFLAVIFKQGFSRGDANSPTPAAVVELF